MIFWTNFTKYLCHDSIGLIITNYSIVRSSSSFLEGQSDSQYRDVKDVNVFTGFVVEIIYIASWYQKIYRKNSFLCSIQWCNPHLATMLRSGNIKVSYVAFQKNHTVQKVKEEQAEMQAFDCYGLRCINSRGENNITNTDHCFNLQINSLDIFYIQLLSLIFRRIFFLLFFFFILWLTYSFLPLLSRCQEVRVGLS